MSPVQLGSSLLAGLVEHKGAEKGQQVAVPCPTPAWVLRVSRHAKKVDMVVDPKAPGKSS